MHEATRTFKSHSGLAIAAGIVPLSLVIPRSALAGSDVNPICDLSADYLLGVEDYADAICAHREVLREHPRNALAHYHLGFAEGMVNMKNTIPQFKVTVPADCELSFQSDAVPREQFFQERQGSGALKPFTRLMHANSDRCCAMLSGQFRRTLPVEEAAIFGSPRLAFS